MAAHGVRRARGFVHTVGCFAARISPFSAKDCVKITGCFLSDFTKRRNFSSIPPRGSRIFSGVCVQRLPVITKEKSELEKRFEQLQDQLELEHSALSEDEVQWKEILQRKEKNKDEDDDESIAIAVSEAERKQFEEEQEEELRRYEPGSRQTEADKLNNLKSLNRKLQETLILLVKRQKDALSWEVPCAEVMDTNDTLQQVASRSLNETCGTDLMVQFLSKAPIAVMKKYKNTSNKVFFYKVNYVTGCVRLHDDYFDHIWVTIDEMRDFVDKEYFKTLKRFLF